MEQVVVYKRPGYYSMGPVPQLLAEGRLAIGLISSPFADHYGLADWVVVVSDDQGRTFRQTDDQTIPLAWPGTNPRERYDRLARTMPDGTYLATGSVGIAAWPAERREEAIQQGRSVRPHPNGSPDWVVVGNPTMFVQRSRNGGQTWERREWPVPGCRWCAGFPRATVLADGTMLVPIQAENVEGTRGQTMAWRSEDGGENWRLLPMGTSVSDALYNEMCFLEVEPGRVLAQMRHQNRGAHLEGYLYESWSDDAGRTWSHPLRTDIKGYPPHLLRLRDGRILCAVTYRWKPMGIRAVLSEDGGRTWDTENPIILRDDAGTRSSLWPTSGRNPEEGSGADVGYPITVQFADDSLFTCYWITGPDGITHAAGTRWRV